MQSYPKTAEKQGLHLWKAQSTASDVSPEWRERTQHSLASLLPAKFPSWTQEKHCPVAPPWSHMTERPTPFLPSGWSPEQPEGSELLPFALLGAQSKTREMKKTQTHWEWCSSKHKLTRSSLHPVYLQSATSMLHSPSLAAQKISSLTPTRVTCAASSWECCLPLPTLPPSSWKLPQWHTRDTTFPPGIQPAKKVDGTTPK